MMWNQNDTKYIIKRLILYALISCIVFFGAQSCAKAEVISSEWSTIKASSSQYADVTGRSGDIAFSQPVFQNRGQGYVIFQVYSAPLSDDQGNDPIFGISVTDNQSIWECEMSTNIWYVDNHTQRHIINVKCPVQIGVNGLRSWKYQRGSDGHLFIKTSDYITFVGDGSDASTIVNGINSQIQAQINAGNTNAQTISNAINTSTQNEINAINAATQATQDNTAAINAQTQWQQQNFNVDTTQIDAITDLISTGDKNKIRDLMMFPARILMLIGAHIGSDYCTAYNLGSLYGTNLILPCINWKTYVGTTLYNTIDTILSIGIYIGIIIYVRKLLDYAFSLGATTFESVNVEVFK